MGSNIFSSFSFESSRRSSRRELQNPKVHKAKATTASFVPQVKTEEGLDDDIRHKVKTETYNVDSCSLDISHKVKTETEDVGSCGLDISHKVKAETDDVDSYCCDISHKVKIKAEEETKVVADIEETPTILVAKGNAPPNWLEIINGIRSMRATQDAPVDQMGTHQLADEAADKITQQFHLLVAAMISSQTRDSVTSAAMMRLRALPGGLTIHNINKNEVKVEQLSEILKPVGFYRQKAKHLKAIAEKLSAPPYNGVVPGKLDELMKLPGVGPKVALLVLWVAFGSGGEGFIVDTNVRRVCCRLGWAAEGSKPEQVRASLENWLPKDLWPELSFLFVGFGQQICKPINPQCEMCTVKTMCPSRIQDQQDQRQKTKKRRVTSNKP